MVARGCSSNTSAVTFEKCTFQMDTTWYAGATVSYSWEIVAYNDDSSARDVLLLDDAGVTIATIEVPASTTDYTRFDAGAITPNSGEDIYKLRLEGTTGANDVRVRASRIVVTVDDPTAMTVSIPLIGFAGYSNATNDPVLSSSSTSYTVVNFDRICNFAYNSAKWATVDGFQLMGAMGKGSAGNTIYGSMFANLTQVASSELSDNGADTTLIFVKSSTWTSDANWSEGGDYYFKVKVTGGSTVAAFHAWLLVHLTPVTKFQLHYPLLEPAVGGSSPFEYLNRQLNDLTNIQGGTSQEAFFEASMKSTGAGSGQLAMSEAGESDSAALNSEIVELTRPAGATYEQQRSADVWSSLTDQERLVSNINAGGGDLQMQNAWLIYQIEGEVGDGGGGGATGEGRRRGRRHGGANIINCNGPRPAFQTEGNGQSRNYGFLGGRRVRG
jgi:hypothetical protein